MNLAAAWSKRIAGPSGTELEQVALRLIIGLLIGLYSIAFSTEANRTLLGLFAGWLVLAAGLFGATWAWPTPSTSRRVLGLIGDIGILTVAAVFLVTVRLLAVWIYLFIIFGCAFRYGRAYALFTQFLSIAGLITVATTLAWWQSQPAVVMSSLMGLIVLPLYVSVLVERINRARANAEEALKKCFDGQARAS